MSKYALLRAWVLIPTLFSIWFNASAQKVIPKLNIGFTHYSYLHEDYIGVILDTRITQSIITAPTIGLRLEVPEYHFGFEVNYYQASVPTVSPNFFQAYAKTFTDVGAYAVFDRWRFSAFYTSTGIRNFVRLTGRNFQDNAYENGIGIGVSYSFLNYEIAYRMERLFYFFYNDNSPEPNIWFGHTFKISKTLDLLTRKEDAQESTSESIFGINMQLGTMVTGNALRGRGPSMSFVKISPTLGFEFSYKDYQIYLRRSVWISPEVYSPIARKFTSLYNQIGMGYSFSLPREQQLFIGMHHFWNYARGQQYMDVYEAQQNNANIPSDAYEFIPNNKGIGIELKYPLNQHFDLILDSDFYYEVHPQLRTVVNPESFRMGVLFNLR